jgi:glycine betaine catabolism B
MATILTLIKKQPVGGNVWSFIFEPSQPLTWIAGQFIRVELSYPTPDAEGTKRYFTIASAPHESHIQLSTRLTNSSFKQALAELPPDGQLNLLDHPAGDFIWPQTDKPIILVAQGIGITPFYSMLKSRSHHNQPLNASLFHTSRTNDTPFRTELTSLAKTHPELRLTFATGPITASGLTGQYPGLADSLVYVSGPGTIIELLGPPYDLPPSSLKQDFFPNYAATSY